jgi:hypothetical protein
MNTNCKTWGLDINIKRTKSIVFSSSGRINKTDFKYDYKPIEKGRSYKYLGINVAFLYGPCCCLIFDVGLVMWFFASQGNDNKHIIGGNSIISWFDEFVDIAQS